MLHFSLLCYGLVHVLNDYCENSYVLIYDFAIRSTKSVIYPMMFYDFVFTNIAVGDCSKLIIVSVFF